MDPFAYLNEIKLLASVAFSYLCYRKLTSTDQSIISDSESEPNEMENQNLDEDLSHENIPDQEALDGKVKMIENDQIGKEESVIDEDHGFESALKSEGANTGEMPVQIRKLKKWNRIRRSKDKLNIKIRKMKKKRLPTLRLKQRIQSI